MKHRVLYTYARGRVRVGCSCGQAQTKWYPADTPKPELRAALGKAHPKLAAS